MFFSSHDLWRIETKLIPSCVLNLSRLCGWTCVSSWFSYNSEAFASELLKSHEEIFLLLVSRSRTNDFRMSFKRSFNSIQMKLYLKIWRPYVWRNILLQEIIVCCVHIDNVYIIKTFQYYTICVCIIICTYILIYNENF